MDHLGFSLALVAMVLFGLYMVPRKFSRLNDFGFVLTMCLGAAVTTQAGQFIVHGGHLPPVSARGAWLAFSCGPIWSLGILFYTLAVSQMGLTLATPIKNTTAVLGTVVGLAAFSEWRQVQPVVALAGSLLVVACAILLARTGERAGARSFATPAGVLFALLAALFFATYTVPLKLAQAQRVDTYRLIAAMGLGTLAGSIPLTALFGGGWREWRRHAASDHLWAALAGAIWALATIAMAEAIRRIGLALTWPLTNLNTVVTVAAGILVFHEVDPRKHARLIALAMLCAGVGTLLLGLARL